MKEYYTISELNAWISALISDEPELRDVWLRGEISGFKLYRQSGHMYFTLKDPQSVLSCVMFRSAASNLAFEPEDGLDVLVRGSVNVYPAQGRYQLYAKEMQPAGLGAIYLYIEQLKQKLGKEGLFDESRKRPIPPDACRIGIVSSQDSAALQDMLRILKQRSPFVEVVVAHSAVQGFEAPAALAAAIDRLNAYGALDVIIIGRGGGSIEDLMAFNSEDVVRAVRRSAIPVISAVGHETDFTLSDLAADLRAATPTHAASLAVPDYQTVVAAMPRMQKRLTEAIQRQIGYSQEKLDRLMMRRVWQEPRNLFESQSRTLEALQGRLRREIALQLHFAAQRLQRAGNALDQLSPLKVLGRGYAILTAPDGPSIHSTSQIQPGDRLRARLKDGTIDTLVLDIYQKED